MARVVFKETLRILDGTPGTVVIMGSTVGGRIAF